MVYCCTLYRAVFLILLILASVFSLYFVKITHNENFLNKCQPQVLSYPSPLNISHLINAHHQNTAIDELSILCFDVGLNLNWEQFLPSSLFLRSPSINTTTLHRIAYRYSSWKSLSPFDRVLTPCEHALLMRLLIIIEHICRQNHITFFMAFGTLIGSWRHHDIIPWDGDADLLMSINDKPRLFEILSPLNNSLIQFDSLHSSTPVREYFKISFKVARNAGRYRWKFPFVDMFFYQSNNTHIWIKSVKSFLTAKTNIFPLKMRPFGQLWLPAPKYPKSIIPSNVESTCIKGAYNYRTESSMRTRVANCNLLKKIYPFVNRNSTEDPVEILKRGDQIFQRIIYE